MRRRSQRCRANRCDAALPASAPPRAARNPYGSNPPDFARLAAAYPDDFARFVKGTDKGGHACIDFQDPEAVRALNHVLLRHDFGIYALQPPDKLCPGIPNRLNYLLWLQDILEASLDSHGKAIADFHHDIEPSSADTGPLEVNDSDDHVDGPRKRRKIEDRSPDSSGRTEEAADSSVSTIPSTLDIGTGATAIYPLLGCAISPVWRFVGADIDQSSLESAQGILDDKRNEEIKDGGASRSFHTEPLRLSSRISLLQRRSEDTLVPTAAEVAHARDSTSPLFHATMCNPPFYRDAEEMQSSLAAKKEPPHAVCSGSPGEMITPGGEVAFVTRLVQESLTRRRDVTWYTSMLGKLLSVSEIVRELVKNDIDNYAITELTQGKTKRWAIAWTFAPHRLPDEIARAANVAAQLPASNSTARILPYDLVEASTRLRALIRSLDGAAIDAYRPPAARADEIESKAATQSFHIRLSYNSWNRAARRKKQQTDASEGPSTASQVQAEPLLCVLCHLTAQEDTDHKDGEATMPSPPARAQAGEVGHLPSVAAGKPVQLRVQWTYGHSRKDFLSFSTMLLRRLETRPTSAAGEVAAGPWKDDAPDVDAGSR